MKLGSTTTHLSSIVMLSLVLAGLAPSGALAQSQSDEWQWRGTIYGWFPGVNGTANLPTGGSTNVETDISDILDALDFTFMGTLEARKGRWGGLVDLIYLDLSNSKSGSRSFNFSGPSGVINIPADASLNASVGLKSWVWTLAGTYTVVEKPGVRNAAPGRRPLSQGRYQS